MKKPCVNKCTTTSLAADIVCKGCGLTDDERREWGGYSETRKASVATVCAWRLLHYEEVVKVIHGENK